MAKAGAQRQRSANALDCIGGVPVVMWGQHGMVQGACVHRGVVFPNHCPYWITCKEATTGNPNELASRHLLRGVFIGVGHSCHARYRPFITRGCGGVGCDGLWNACAKLRQTLTDSSFCLSGFSFELCRGFLLFQFCETLLSFTG
jgi:hypothetical protein